MSKLVILFFIFILATISTYADMSRTRSDYLNSSTYYMYDDGNTTLDGTVAAYNDTPSQHGWNRTLGSGLEPRYQNDTALNVSYQYGKAIVFNKTREGDVTYVLYDSPDNATFYGAIKLKFKIFTNWSGDNQKAVFGMTIYNSSDVTIHQIQYYGASDFSVPGQYRTPGKQMQLTNLSFDNLNQVNLNEWNNITFNFSDVKSSVYSFNGVAIENISSGGFGKFRVYFHQIPDDIFAVVALEDIVIETGIPLGDISAPGFLNLTNTSTFSTSAKIFWETNESTNTSFILFNNSARTIAVLNYSNSTFSTTKESYFEGLKQNTTYFLNITIFDSSGNIAKNETFNFTTPANTDVTAPGISGYALLATTWYSDEYVTFYLNCTDNSSIEYTKFTLDTDGLNRTMTAIVANSEYVYNSSTFGVGEYNITDVYCKDIGGNINHTITNLPFSVSTRPTGTSGGGGGGGSAPERVCNVSGKVWDVRTTFGQLGYTFGIPYQNAKAVEKDIMLTNYGTSEINIKLSCEKTDENEINICDSIQLSNSSLQVHQNEQEPEIVKMYVSYPEDATTDDQFSFNIIADDKESCIFKLNNRAYVTRFSFSKYKVFNASALKSDWDDITYPVVVPAMIVWLLFLGIGVQVSRRKSSPLLGIFFIGIILGGAAFAISIVL